VALRHLSDAEIQDFLDGNLPDREDSLEIHINQCPHCRSRVIRYRMLYKELREDTIPRFKDDYAASVMSYIKAKSSVAPGRNPKATLGYIFLALCGLVLAIYFVDFSRMAALFRFSAFRTHLINSFIPHLSRILKELDISPGIILSVGLAVAVAFIVDHLIKQYRAKSVTFLA
jgi:hypothetical protein